MSPPGGLWITLSIAPHDSFRSAFEAASLLPRCKPSRARRSFYCVRLTMEGGLAQMDENGSCCQGMFLPTMIIQLHGQE